MHNAYLGLGTNIGNKQENIERAISMLAEKAGTILAFSTLYETVPWGFESENNFLNSVVLLATPLSHSELHTITRSIETEMGRAPKSGDGYQDRIIDIDLLLYDELIIQTPELTLPHPLMHKRRFVLQPLCEIAPELIHPVLNKTIRELLYSQFRLDGGR